MNPRVNILQIESLKIQYMYLIIIIIHNLRTKTQLMTFLGVEFLTEREDTDPFNGLCRVLLFWRIFSHSGWKGRSIIVVTIVIVIITI